jgi:hypothetical protein
MRTAVRLRLDEDGGHGASAPLPTLRSYFVPCGACRTSGAPRMEGARYLEDGRLTIFKRSGVFYARIRNSDSGKYIWRSLKTSNEQTAVDLGRRLLFQIEQRAEHGLPPKSKLLAAVIDDYIRYRERDHRHAKTSAGMLRQIIRVSMEVRHDDLWNSKRLAHCAQLMGLVGLLLSSPAVAAIYPIGGCGSPQTAIFLSNEAWTRSGPRDKLLI